MAHFRTCRTCERAAGACEIRDRLRAAVAGLAVSSLKHRCPTFSPLYKIGQPIEVLTVAWTGLKETYDYGEQEPPRHWYPGHVIRWSVGGALIVFVREGTLPVLGADPFEPRASGFIKVPMSRVRPSDHAPPIDTSECVQCGAIVAVGQPCNFEPYSFHTKAKCAFARRSDVAVEAA